MTRQELYYFTTVAYLDARQNERNKLAHLEFEYNLETNLWNLVDELYTRTWKPSPMSWFVMIDPTIREVFSPVFKDRIVSHILFNFMYPIFERYFIYDSYSCRKNKGTLFGIKRFEHHIRSVTNNYTLPGYCLNIDISGYFMAINRSKLYDFIIKILTNPKNVTEHFDFIDYLLKSYLFRDPLENAIFVGNKNYIKFVPENKSLFHSKEGVGLPIGDVVNQLNSNIYMNVFDQFVKRILHIKHYGRYVDDSRLLHNSYSHLLEIKDRCSEFLYNELDMNVHPNKTTITDLYETNYFLGAAFKPHRIYVIDKTIKRTKRYFKELNKLVLDPEFNPYSEISHINSYLGYYKHFNEYKFIDKLIKDNKNIINIYGFTRYYEKAIIRKK